MSSKRKNKFGLIQEQIKELPEVLEFIESLQRQIEKQKKKIKKLKQNTKCKNVSHVSTQIHEEDLSKPFSITEEITNAAEEALRTNGFVYEETSGLYYDYSSGYYYNAEYGLYYDGNSGTYLKYNTETKEYDFHSQVPLKTAKHNENGSLNRVESHDKQRSVVVKKRKHRKRKHSEDDEDKKFEKEEGECSDHSERLSSDEESSNDFAKNWPCMRIIVEESATLKPGSLHVVTVDGGSVGREGKQHAIIVADINVSKHHFDVSFDQNHGHYLITDVGSRNGTYLNGKRLSASKELSEPMEIVHGSRIQLGATVLLCHIHAGTQTCGHCEPGLLVIPSTKDTKDVAEENNVCGLNSKNAADHKEQLKKLRKKFGLTHGDPGKNCPGAGYVDRAQNRRDTVGSQNPHEKTQQASIHESIPSNNKGYEMLSKLGWKQGDALGKDNVGQVEPVPLVSNEGFSGLGHG